jgi:predicted transcriptional regulator
MVGEIKKLMLSGIDVTVTHMEILEFFRNNPGVVDDPQGIAMRLGLDVNLVQRCIDDMMKVNILTETKVGEHKVYSINPEYGGI